jgi:hypothetical protein
VISPEEFAASLRAAASFLERAREHLAAGQEPAESTARLLGTTFEGSSQPSADAAVEASNHAVSRLTSAITLLDQSAGDLASYMSQVLGTGTATTSFGGPAPSGAQGPATGGRTLEQVAGRPQQPASPAAEPKGSNSTSSAAETPSARLPNAAAAKIPEAKFLRYSMDPSANNNGKWRAWRELGYDTEENREAAADDVTQQLRHGLPTSPAERPQQTAYGLRLTTGTDIRGLNGRRGTLRCVWQYDLGSDEPRLITNWLDVHRKEQR